MKVKVIRDFVDIHTGELHTQGSSFECSEERYKEIKSAGEFVEPEKEARPEAAPVAVAKKK